MILEAFYLSITRYLGNVEITYFGTEGVVFWIKEACNLKTLLALVLLSYAGKEGAEGGKEAGSWVEPQQWDWWAALARLVNSTKLLTREIVMAAGAVKQE
jgi:hypothetical protein